MNHQRRRCSLGRLPDIVLGMSLTCAFAGPAAADISLRVVTSIKPVHSLVSTVMDSVGEPQLIIKGGASPHTFSMRPSDAVAFRDSDIVFLIDETLETALSGIVETVAKDARVVKLSGAKGLVVRSLRKGGAFEADPQHEHEHEENDGHHHGENDGHHDEDEAHAEENTALQGTAGQHMSEHGPRDPHIWLDPANAQAMTRLITDTLSEVDPENAATYRTNGQALINHLSEVTIAIAEELAPVRGVPFVVFHDGYRYFEDRFGLTIAGSVVVSPRRPPGVRRIRELREKINELGVSCILDEPQFDRRFIDTIVEGMRVQVGTVDPLGAMIDDGPELYFTLLRNMASSFKNCLTTANSD